jgi:hypothetical protein
MVSGLGVFAEAISIVPFVHTKPKPGLRCLVVGFEASPLGALYVRYPETGQVLYYKTKALDHGKAKVLPGIAQATDINWKADVAAVAVPGSPLNEIATIRPLLADDGVLAVAIDDSKKANEIRLALKVQFPFVIPYRAHLPEPAVFFICSRAPVARARPVPDSADHLSDQYLPCLFTFAKDEYRSIMQGIS